MYKDKSIAVVIPCFNVENHIVDVIGAMPDFVDKIICVNDASPDDTAQRLAPYTNSDRVIILVHGVNQGLGGAMVTGFKCALNLGMDIVIKIDGDGQMDPKHIPVLINSLVNDKADYAKGNRFLHSKELRQMPVIRILGNIALTFITKFASGYWHVFDPQNGYIAIKGEFLAMLDLDRLAQKRFFFENEMLIQNNVLCSRVMDVPLSAFYGMEKSTLKISNVLLYFPLLFLRGFTYRMIQRYILRDFSIIIPYYFFGWLFLFWGVVFGAIKWLHSIQTGIATATGTIMLTVLPIIVGIQFILQGIMIDIMQTPRGER